MCNTYKLILLIPCLLLLTQAAFNAPVIKFESARIDKINLIGRLDTTKKAANISVSVKMTKPPKVSLLKKLLDALKFRKNFRAKEKDRIITIVDSMVINNDRLATTENLNLKTSILTKQDSAHYNELLTLINALQKEMPVITPESPADSAAREQKNLEAILSKIVPILKGVTNNQSININRQKRVQKLRALFGRSENQTDTLNLSDSIALVYKLRLTHKASILGVERNPPLGSDLTYNYNLLSTLQFERFELNSHDGFCRELAGEGTTELSKNAQRNGKGIYLSVFPGDGSLGTFLKNPQAQRNFLGNIIKLLRTRNAKGINLNLGKLPVAENNSFNAFIKDLQAVLKTESAKIKLSVTIPAGQTEGGYDITTLDKLVDFFIVDFLQTNHDRPGPIAPISGKNPNNLQVNISYLLNSGIPPAKLFIGIPYRGIKWSYSKIGGKGFAPELLPYRTIRTSYENFFYNADTSVAYAAKTVKELTDTVWYDDENTLAKKYDFILLNKLGGVALTYLGDDDGFGELWDVLTDKFLQVDTIKVKLLHKKPNELTWSQKLKVYYVLFEKPCDTLFRVDVIKMLNITSLKQNIIQYKIYSDKARHFFLIVNIILGILAILGVAVIIYYFKMEGDDWAYRKLFLGSTTVVFVLLITTLASSAFLSDNIILFGASNGSDCINMPFPTLLLIILFGIIIGILLMRFLILPFVKRQEVP